MRNIFFEDEIDYFRETALSLFNEFIKSRECEEATPALLDIMDKIKNGLDIQEIIKMINPENIDNLIIEKIKNNLLQVECNLNVIDEVLHVLRRILAEHPLKPLTKSLNNLFYAVQNKSAYLEKHQIELERLEKDENLQLDWLGNSRLLLAIERDDIKSINYFIDRSLFINKANYSGNTPLMLAAKKGLHQLLQALLDHGAHIDTSLQSVTPFKTALYHAIMAKQQVSATLLISAGAKTSFAFNKYLGHKIEHFSLLDLANDNSINLSSSTFSLEMN